MNIPKQEFRIGEEEKLRNDLLHILFHGTSKENADRILIEGFQPYTYFAKNLRDAINMGGEYVFFVMFEHKITPEWFENFRCWQIRNKHHIPPNKIVSLKRYSVDSIFNNKKLANRIFKRSLHYYNEIERFEG